MTIDRKFLALGAAGLVAAGGIGFGVARFTAPAEVAQAGHEEGTETHPRAGFVPLKPAAAPAAGVDIVQPERGGAADLLLAGRVVFAPNAEANVGAPIGGTVVSVHVAAGTRVGIGTPLATLRSADGAATRAALDAAAAGVNAARAGATRERRLFDAGVSARQDWEAARATSLKAEAELRAARAQTAAQGSPGSNGLLVVRSPIAGIVNRIAVAPGSVIATGGEVATLANPTLVELLFDMPPASLGLVHPGATIRAQLPGGGVIDAVVTAVAPGTGGAPGIVRARAIGAAPPVGTILSARLAAGSGTAITVPSDAVQTIDGVPSVFVAEAGGFRARPVVTGPSGSGRTEIRQGLTGTERIAGTGAFLLKAELAKGEGGHED